MGRKKTLTNDEVWASENTKEELDALERGEELERFEENIELNELDTIVEVER